jgi:primosomal protein N'
VVVDISPDEFGLKLSPHLSSALRHSGKQEKEQEFLQAIKQQAKCVIEETIAKYSVPSPTLIKRQKNRVRHEYLILYRFGLRLFQPVDVLLTRNLGDSRTE